MVDNPYYIVADFEASNATDFEPVTTTNSSAEKIHRINSYCLYLYIHPDLDDFPYDEFEERLCWKFANGDSEADQKQLIREFFAQLNSLAQRLTEWRNLIDTEGQLRRLKAQHNDSYLNDTMCILQQSNRRRRQYLTTTTLQRLTMDLLILSATY